MSERLIVMAEKLVLSLVVCGLGGWCMYLTHGEVGIGWAVLGFSLVLM